MIYETLHHVLSPKQAREEEKRKEEERKRLEEEWQAKEMKQRTQKFKD